jgi:hypothetical protein
VHRGQLGRGVDAQLFGQHPPGVLEDRQRLGRPPAGVQRPHQLHAQPLPQRVRGHQRLQLRHDPALPPHGQLRLDAILDGGQTQLLQPGHLRLGSQSAGHIGQGWPAPQPQRLTQQRGGARMITGRQRLPPLAGQPLEAVRVDILRVDREPVPRRLELDQAAGITLVAQPATEPGHLGLQRVGGIARRVLAVQAIDQPRSADHPARLQQQQGQQRARPRPTDGHHAPVGRPHLHGAQDAKPHGTDYRAAAALVCLGRWPHRVPT